MCTHKCRACYLELLLSLVAFFVGVHFYEVSKRGFEIFIICGKMSPNLIRKKNKRKNRPRCARGEANVTQTGAS